MLVTRRSAVIMAALGALALTGCTPENVSTGSTTGSDAATMRRDIADISGRASLPHGSELMYQGYVLKADDGSHYVATGERSLEIIPDDTIVEAVGRKSAERFFVYRYELGATEAEELEANADDERYAYVYDTSATISEEDGVTYVRFPDLASY